MDQTPNGAPPKGGAAPTPKVDPRVERYLAAILTGQVSRSGVPTGLSTIRGCIECAQNVVDLLDGKK